MTSLCQNDVIDDVINWVGTRPSATRGRSLFFKVKESELLRVKYTLSSHLQSVVQMCVPFIAISTQTLSEIIFSLSHIRHKIKVTYLRIG